MQYIKIRNSQNNDNMHNLNKEAERTQRACTTPQRMRLVQSIKKSIHRTMQKINPADYKNILRGQYIYIHLCHKGEVINSQYTKVALFMGGVVFKKASQKITAVITNEPANKLVKKLSGMGKPILSVLWLQACFQEKRKVPYQDFIYQQNHNHHKDYNQLQELKQEEISANLQSLVDIYKEHLLTLTSKKQHPQPKPNKSKLLRFIDKRQKSQKYKCSHSHNDNKLELEQDHIILPHQIDLSVYQQQRRKSQIISEKIVKKRNEKKKQEHRSEGNKQQDAVIPNKQSKFIYNIKDKNDINADRKQKQKLGKKVTIVSNNQLQLQLQQHGGGDEDDRQNRLRGNYGFGDDESSKRPIKTVYEKYLKEYNSFKQDKNKNKEQINQVLITSYPTQCQSQKLNLQTDQTPNFFQTQPQPVPQTPKKPSSPPLAHQKSQSKQQLLQTCSIRKLKSNSRIPMTTLRFNVINPMLAEKIARVNQLREENSIPVIEVAGGYGQGMVWVISKQSKIQAIMALLSKPKAILSHKFVQDLQKNPLLHIPNLSSSHPQPTLNPPLPKYQLNCQLIEHKISNKNIVLLDSVIGCSSLQSIIKGCGGKVLNLSDFLFEKGKVDIVITNKKNYIKTEKDRYVVMNEGDFIDLVLRFGD